MLIILLVCILALAWYLPLFICQGKKDAVPKRYSVITFFTVFILGSITAVITNAYATKLLLNVFKLEESSILYLFVDALFSTALKEELIKFLIGYLVIKLAKPVRKLDYVLILGAAGVGFAIAEDIVYGLSGGISTCFVRGIIPIHLMLQMRMGGHIYETEQAKKLGDSRRKAKEWILALAVPILFHGIYDFAVFLNMKTLNSYQEGQAVMASGIIIVILCTLFGLLTIGHCIATEVWAAKMVKASRE